jgi:hypothetical protein
MGQNRILNSLVGGRKSKGQPTDPPTATPPKSDEESESGTSSGSNKTKPRWKRFVNRVKRRDSGNSDIPLPPDPRLAEQAATQFVQLNEASRKVTLATQAPLQYVTSDSEPDVDVMNMGGADGPMGKSAVNGIVSQNLTMHPDPEIAKAVATALVRGLTIGVDPELVTSPDEQRIYPSIEDGDQYLEIDRAGEYLDLERVNEYLEGVRAAEYSDSEDGDDRQSIEHADDHSQDEGAEDHHQIEHADEYPQAESFLFFNAAILTERLHALAVPRDAEDHHQVEYTDEDSQVEDGEEHEHIEFADESSLIDLDVADHMVEHTDEYSQNQDIDDHKQIEHADEDAQAEDDVDAEYVTGTITQEEQDHIKFWIYELELFDLTYGVSNPSPTASVRTSSTSSGRDSVISYEPDARYTRVCSSLPTPAAFKAMEFPSRQVQLRYFVKLMCYMAARGDKVCMCHVKRLLVEQGIKGKNTQVNTAYMDFRRSEMKLVDWNWCYRADAANDLALMNEFDRLSDDDKEDLTMQLFPRTELDLIQKDDWDVYLQSLVETKIIDPGFSQKLNYLQVLEREFHNGPAGEWTQPTGIDAPTIPPQPLPLTEEVNDSELWYRATIPSRHEKLEELIKAVVYERESWHGTEYPNAAHTLESHFQANKLTQAGSPIPDALHEYVRDFSFVEQRQLRRGQYVAELLTRHNAWEIPLDVFREIRGTLIPSYGQPNIRAAEDWRTFLYHWASSSENGIEVNEIPHLQILHPEYDECLLNVAQEAKMFSGMVAEYLRFQDDEEAHVVEIKKAKKALRKVKMAAYIKGLPRKVFRKTV